MKETRLWFLHITCGGIILCLLGLHMAVMHLDQITGLFSLGGHAVDWVNVAHRSKTVLFAVIYILLLGAALYHGLYGLRSILLEIDFLKTWKKPINVLFCLAGIILFTIGSIANIAFVIIR